VRGVFTHIYDVCETLKKNVCQAESDLAPISIMSATSSTNMNELDQSLMYSQLLKEILLDLPHDNNNMLTTIVRWGLLLNLNKSMIDHLLSGGTLESALHILC
jgi:hypothetical protein